MITAILVDDEPNNLENLSTLLKTYCPQVAILGMAQTADEAQKLYARQEPDVLFLDIEMPEKTGFQLLEALQPMQAEVIFVTAFGHYALKAIKYSALDYILKPISIEELQEAVKKAERKLAAKQPESRLQNLLENLSGRNRIPKIALPLTERVEFVPEDQILRCQSDNNYTHVYLLGGRRLLISKTLREFQDLLSEARFLRVHQSHLVNIDAIRSLVRRDGGYLELSDGTQVPVSQNRRNEVWARLRKG
jgi:two-component system LytT family response regulator